MEVPAKPTKVRTHQANPPRDGDVLLAVLPRVGDRVALSQQRRNPEVSQCLLHGRALASVPVRAELNSISAIDARTWRESWIFLRRIASSVFMRVNARCDHQLLICARLGRHSRLPPRLTSKRQSLDTAGSALTGRHPPAAREASHLSRLEFGALHLLSAWFQRVTGGS